MARTREDVRWPYTSTLTGGGTTTSTSSVSVLATVTSRRSEDMAAIVLFFVLIVVVAFAFYVLMMAVLYIVWYGTILAAVIGALYLFVLLVCAIMDGVQGLRQRRDLARRAPARQAWVAYHGSLDPVEARAFAHGQRDDRLLQEAAPVRERTLICRAQASNAAGMSLVADLAAVPDASALHSQGWRDGAHAASLSDILDDRTRLLRELATTQPFSIPHPALTYLVHAPLWHVLTRLGSELTSRSPDPLELQVQHHLAQGLWSQEAAT